MDLWENKKLLEIVLHNLPTFAILLVINKNNGIPALHPRVFFGISNEIILTIIISIIII
jgi:hypothetical protein